MNISPLSLANQIVQSPSLEAARQVWQEDMFNDPNVIVGVFKAMSFMLANFQEINKAFILEVLNARPLVISSETAKDFIQDKWLDLNEIFHRGFPLDVKVKVSDHHPIQSISFLAFAAHFDRMHEVKNVVDQFEFPTWALEDTFAIGCRDIPEKMEYGAMETKRLKSLEMLLDKGVNPHARFPASLMYFDKKEYFSSTTYSMSAMDILLMSAAHYKEQNHEHWEKLLGPLKKDWGVEIDDQWSPMFLWLYAGGNMNFAADMLGYQKLSASVKVNLIIRQAKEEMKNPDLIALIKRGEARIDGSYLYEEGDNPVSLKTVERLLHKLTRAERFYALAIGCPSAEAVELNWGRTYKAVREFIMEKDAAMFDVMWQIYYEASQEIFSRFDAQQMFSHFDFAQNNEKMMSKIINQAIEKFELSMSTPQQHHAVSSRKNRL